MEPETRRLGFEFFKHITTLNTFCLAASVLGFLVGLGILVNLAADLL